MKRKVGKALVVGAGISGIRAALDLAETGYGVTLIEQSPHLGGILSQLDYQFPTNRCGMCKMLPLVDRDASSQHCLRKGLFHENIEILLSTELVSVEGEAGHFQVMLKQKPNWISPELCVGCGECVKVCPVEVPDLFNAGLASRKAIYLPVPHAIPNPYVIDFAACTLCGECEKVCPTAAIRLSGQERKKFRVLVVDDELIVRDSLKEWLGDEGFTVDTAESGPEALERLAESQYHLMLTDIKMPGMDGVELLEKAKEALPDLTVVMMTAYATVETAVEAMKIGALDYLVKPFDPEDLAPMVLGIYEDIESSKGRQMEVGALVLSGGTDYFDPSEGKNILGYGIYPNVVTSVQFERILSGTGPYQGNLVRPDDNKAIQKVAWLQCAGSRDVQLDADFCSNICCMYSIKEALVAKEKTGGKLETSIFYMDMRTFGKSFQRYRDAAETEKGVRFVRSRIHSLTRDDASGDLVISHVDSSGERHEEKFDMAVLSVGQRPTAKTEKLAELTEIDLNPWGFVQTEPFSLTQTKKEGIVAGGSFSGLSDVSDSVIQASAAALAASRVIHSAGGSLAPELPPEVPMSDVARELPNVLVAVCTCGESLSNLFDPEELAGALTTDPSVGQVVFIEQTCTATGWEALVEHIENHKPNRVLIGACLPYVYARKLKELGRQVGLDPSLMEVVDLKLIREISQVENNEAQGQDAEAQNDPPDFNFQVSVLQAGLAKIKRIAPSPVASVKVEQQALVIGGGIAGMTAALAIADHGFHVDLVEQSEVLGGNLIWLKQTLEGHDTDTLLKDTMQKIEKHPLIDVHTQNRVVAGHGQVGRFQTIIEGQEGEVQTLEHGVTILATGGKEAETTAYSHGDSDAVVTQKELDIRLNDNTIDPGQLKSVVMVQCVGSREEPRNYCSRVCCTSALKNALHLKKQNPEINIYILYRDMMSYGFSETYFTQAREAGVLFVQYDLENRPEVRTTDSSIKVTIFEPILAQNIEIDADLVVLATGVVSDLPAYIAEGFGASIDQDGFFQEAESKWRPVDSLMDGVFACGLAHSPRSISESIATAEAAAQRSLRILWQEQLPAGKIVAGVRHSLCALCERCIDTCPYGARTLDIDEEEVKINPLMCQGCGSCATVCPNGASILEGFSKQQVLDVIDAALM
ncbi:MAG: FAD-dependent oxidoreductase [Desulfobacterales bacterium]|nr:FAD-dependent oxidoreductase [Desulfobacterales bacterium]